MPEPAQSLLLSACLGALIGLIRQWEVQQEGAAEAEFAGLRTFAVVAMLGCVAALVSDRHAAAVFPVTVGLLGLILAAVQVMRHGTKPAGYTTPGAATLTFFIGALVFWRERDAAVLVAALTMLLLGLKQPIHQWTRRFTLQDVRSALQFVAITGVILPLVPDRDLGPYQAFNPWATWLMVVLIAGLGFLGYLLVRLLGSGAGIALTGLVGGLASSTATTLAFSRRSREDPGRSKGYALAVVLACNVMIARVLVLTAAVSLPFAARLWPALAIMVLPGLGLGAWLWLRSARDREPVDAPRLDNPLSLGTAVKFALLYAGVSFLVKATSSLGLTEGLVGISVLAGLTDVDAIAASLSNAVRGATLPTSVASQALLAGCISNTLLKAALAAGLGSPELRRLVLSTLGATAVAGGIGYALLP